LSDLLVACGLRGPQPHRSKGIDRSGKRAGLDLSFHSLRHTAVSLLKDAGVPDAVVMALVGDLVNIVEKILQLAVEGEAVSKATPVFGKLHRS
jgi:integrase